VIAVVVEVLRGVAVADLLGVVVQVFRPHPEIVDLRITAEVRRDALRRAARGGRDLERNVIDLKTF
jgi:hypothetical protein